MERKLYRSRRERMIAGVCGGLAEYYGVDPTLVRLIAVVLALVSAGAAVIAYIVMAIVVPEEGTVATEGAPTMGDAPQAPYPAAQPSQSAPAAPPAPPTTPASSARERERAGRGGIAFGLVLVFVGLVLLASQFLPGLDMWRLWPLIIVLVGIRTMFRGGE